MVVVHPVIKLDDIEMIAVHLPNVTVIFPIFSTEIGQETVPGSLFPSLCTVTGCRFPGNDPAPSYLCGLHPKTFHGY